MSFIPTDHDDSTELLFTVFDALPDPVFVKNSRHQWIYANRAFARLVGMDDPIGQGDEAIFPPEQVEVFHAHDRRVFAGETTINEEQIGDDMYALTKKTPIRLPDGSTGLVAIVLDITAYKHAEDKARAAEADSAAKSQFLANMSHEIRTPLNGVMGMAQALQAEPLTPQQQEKVSLLIDSGRTLLAVVNDVLDLSKINAGKMEIHAGDADLKELLRGVVELFRPRAAEKGLDLAYSFDIDTPTMVRIDATRTRQCLNNLVSNAIKFTDSGHIEIHVRVRDDGLAPDARKLDIAVSDTGVGMSPEDMSRLFQEFVQVDASDTRAADGSGLGLVITRRLARLMGGDVSVTSREGKGSTFRLTIACTPTARPDLIAEERALAAAPLTDRRILLVDDNALNRKVVSLLLGATGVSIAEAADGAQALEAIAAQPFDAVLMDVQMPVMDGIEAVRRIRAANRGWSATPIVMLTANAMPGDRERFLACGADGYLAKPVDREALVEQLSIAIARHASSQAA
ncbi:MAG: response regulator [Hyphomonadaceae bacterium]